jgi:hypothetical protein
LANIGYKQVVDEPERREEIARMAGGLEITERHRKAVAEMLDLRWLARAFARGRAERPS